MQSYDFLILGSGMAGLACAYILSKEGYSVCVLEKNRQFGGNLQTFSRDKRIFDTGLHYLGGLDEGQNLHQCFSYFDVLDKVQLKRMNENGYDCVSFHDSGEEFFHAMGKERFIETLCASFPQNHTEIKNYIADIEKTCRLFPYYQLNKDKNSASSLSLPFEGAFQYFQKNISNEKLRHVLSGNSMLYAGDEKTSPFQQHALATQSYIQSAWRIVNGGGTLAQAMVKNIKENGGICINYADVAEIAVENNKVKFITTKEGEQITGKNVISNIHPSNTFKLLSGVDTSKAYYQRMLHLPNGISSFSLYISLKENTFPYLNYNYYHIVDKNRFWQPSKETVSPSVMWIMTPPATHTSEFADSMCVTTYMDYNEVAKWQNTYATVPHFNNDRNNEYTDFKENQSQIILDILAQKFPGFKEKVHSYYAATPLTFRDYIGTENGAMYGMVKDFNHPLTSYLPNKTKIDNLFLVGQNINHHGVLGVTINAIKLCAQFLGEDYLLDKIKKR